MEAKGEDDNEEVDTTPELKLTFFTEALAALEDVSAFLESRGYASEATDVMTVSSKVAVLHCKHFSMRTWQTTILDYAVPKE